MKKILYIALLLLICGCGKKDGLYTNLKIIDKNLGGKKSEVVTYKDGKEDGLHTTWYENGQKRKEGTWKDGKKISSKSYSYEDSDSYEESENKYYNVSGGSSSSISTCKTCGLSYTVAILPYGKYCSQGCCRAYEGMSSKCN